MGNKQYDHPSSTKLRIFTPNYVIQHDLIWLPQQNRKKELKEKLVLARLALAEKACFTASLSTLRQPPTESRQ